MIPPSGVTKSVIGVFDQTNRVDEFAEVVAVELVGHATVGRETLHLLDGVSSVDADEPDGIAELGVDLGEVGEFLDTRRTGGEPEVDHEWLAEERRRRDRIAVPIPQVDDRQRVALDVGIGEPVVREGDDARRQPGIDLIVSAVAGWRLRRRTPRSGARRQPNEPASSRGRAIFTFRRVVTAPSRTARRGAKRSLTESCVCGHTTLGRLCRIGPQTAGRSATAARGCCGGAACCRGTTPTRVRRRPDPSRRRRPRDAEPSADARRAACRR